MSSGVVGNAVVNDCVLNNSLFTKKSNQQIISIIIWNQAASFCYSFVETCDSKWKRVSTKILLLPGQDQIYIQLYSPFLSELSPPLFSATQSTEENKQLQ